MIKPTVGRVVWYWPAPQEGHMQLSADQPLAAHVAHVLADDRVNLAVISANGEGMTARRGVFLWNGEGERPKELPFAEWMPYQKAVAEGKTSSVVHATSPTTPLKPANLGTPAK